MRFLLARIMTPPQSHPVKKSTGRFGALQVRKVPGKVLSSVHTNREKNWKGFWESLLSRLPSMLSGCGSFKPVGTLSRC
jgi:hypothetical protein